MGLLDDLSGYGRDFLQGASNAAAGTVSGPVDGMAWLLRQAGAPIPSNPVGGSDWMAQQGLTTPPQNQAAGMLGETAGLLSPAMAAQFAPRIASGLLNIGENASAPTALSKQAGVLKVGDAPSGRLSPLKDGPHYGVDDLSAYTPNLYRETNLSAVNDFLPGNMSQPSTLYFSNDPAYALGQGQNKGVLMEFDAKGVPGQLNLSKPGARQSYDNGYAEFTSNNANPSQIGKNLKSVTIAPSQQSGPYFRRISGAMKQSGWGSSVAADGSIVFKSP